VGIYDRDYYCRSERTGASSYTPRSVVGAIIAVNVALWIADFLVAQAVPGDGHWLSEHLAVHVDTLTQPWLWWQYLTAGFTHSPTNFQHILFNMLVLFFLGRDVEDRCGSGEFLRVYLAMIVFASVVWCVVNKLNGAPAWLGAYGASGAIAGVVVLYAFYFPNRTMLLFFVIPMPAWMLGVIAVAMDIYGASGQGGSSNIAYSMHLAGAAFALVYHLQGWNLTRLTANWNARLSSLRKPRLKVHEPKEESPSDLSVEVDRILEKIYREGEVSLTAKERKTLETASHEYQRKKR
jgi:membrane associated rhomboid family serine protease